MQTFNLVDESWLPCLFVDGSSSELGLLETLARAHEIGEVYDPSPLITTSLLRLLLTLLYRCYPASNDEEFDEIWRTLWSSPVFPVAPLTTYFGKWKPRFFLFDDDFPFYQTPGLTIVQEKKVKAQSQLEPDPDAIFRLHKDTPDTAIAELFDHRHGYETEVAITNAEAARLLVAGQNYGTSASQSGHYTLDFQSKHNPGGRQNGLLFKGLLCFLTGNTLKEALLLNWIPHIPRSGRDVPCWETNDYTERITSSQGKGKAHTPAGLLDTYTWQARMIRLLPPDESDRQIRQVYYTQGRQAQKSFIRDPMKAYIRSAKGNNESILVLRRDKASWRDVNALLKFKHFKQDDTRPEVLQVLTGRLLANEISEETASRILLNVTGQDNDQAKLVLWRHDRLSVPPQFLREPNLTERLTVLLQEAEKVAKQLDDAVSRLCQNFLSPGCYDAFGHIKSGQKPPPGEKVKVLKKCLSATTCFWNSLEPHFYTLLFQLPVQPEEASKAWGNAVETSAKQAFDTAIRRLGNTPQVYKAATLARPDFRLPSRKQKIPAAKKRRTNR